MISILCFIAGVVIGMAASRSAALRSAASRPAGRQFLFKRNVGEALVVNILENVRGLHVPINNVTLQTELGTTQIDHILVTEAGLFVIETKHYTGWIFGNPRDSHWTQTIYRSKSRFQNPLIQNYGHVKTLQALFKLPENAFIGVVVFTGSAEFKTDLGPSTILPDQLLGHVEQRRGKILDERQMAYVVGRIEMKRYTRSTETDEHHINNVRAQIANRKIVAQ